MSADAPKAPGHFTLFELLVLVVAFAGAGWFVLWRAGASERGERAAIASLKIVVAAEIQYRATYGSAIYGTLSQLSRGPRPYIDPGLGAGRKRGYSFVMTVGTPADSNYRLTATPLPGWPAERRAFFVDVSGVVRIGPPPPSHSSEPDADE